MKTALLALLAIFIAMPAFAFEDGYKLNPCSHTNCDNDDTLEPQAIDKRVDRALATAAASEVFITDPTKQFHFNINGASAGTSLHENAVGASVGFKPTDNMYFGGGAAVSADGKQHVVTGNLGFSF